MIPTEKQLDFIEDICEALDLENPNCQTKEQARDFISKYIDEYKSIINESQGEFACGFYWKD